MAKRKGRSQKAEAGILDSRGDLWLCTDSYHDSGIHFPSRSFLVCSRTISRHSPVLSTMVSTTKNNTPSTTDDESSSGGSAGTSPWSIELPEIPSTPLRWLLQLMHGYMPTEHGYGTSLIARYTITVLADRLDCVKLLQFHAPTWISELGVAKLNNATAILRAMCLAYNLGAGDLFAECVERVVIGFPADSKELRAGLSTIMLPTGTKSEFRLLHQDAIESMI